RSMLYTAPEPASLVKAHALEAGPTIVPPKWAFHHWYWRNNHYNRDTYYDGTPVNAPYNSMLVEDVLMMQALDVPCSVYWVDRPWAAGPFGYDDFEWDRERLPNPAEMVDWVHQKGMKFLLWTAPWVMGDMAQEAIKQEYLLPSQMMTAIGITDASQVNDLAFLRGEFTRHAISTIEQLRGFILRNFAENLLDREIPRDDQAALQRARDDLIAVVRNAESLSDYHELILQFSGSRILVDFTNPDARSWWQNQGLRKVLEDGVDGFKMDRSEEIVPQSRDVVAHDGRTTRELRNDYPVEYLKSAYEIAEEIHGDDFALMPRAGYTGSPQYGVFWGGDIAPPAEGLRTAIIAQLRSAVNGYPIWGSDTGGYDDPDDREVVARWLAFSCFSPIMEVGPLDDRGLWDFPTEPHYDTELIAIWRTYAILHTNLADYSYAHARTAHETGMPIVRPLFLEYPEQREAWNNWQTYLYGGDILVSPIWRQGTTEHSLYLPAGERWINAWNTDEVLSGGQTVTVETPLYKIPIFIRRGSDIDLGDLQGLYDESLSIAKERPDLKQLEAMEFRQ
ncbi:MAG TPA: glycoside hydrolase family 31 protein, partial [bacterium]|nr:glycoside hydrolase family 31 protein [bacterium]